MIVELDDKDMSVLNDMLQLYYTQQISEKELCSALSVGLAFKYNEVPAGLVACYLNKVFEIDLKEQVIIIIEKKASQT